MPACRLAGSLLLVKYHLWRKAGHEQNEDFLLSRRRIIILSIKEKDKYPSSICKLSFTNSITICKFELANSKGSKMTGYKERLIYPELREQSK
jgi:hypothetical protein